MSRSSDPFRIVNATLILPDRLVAGGAAHISEGRLTAVGRQQDLPSWSGPTFDATGAFVAPGYVDLHVHGGDNADFMDGTIEAFETAICAHTRHGVTSIVPTSTVATHEQTMTFLSNTRTFQRRGADAQRGLARTLGAHFYGPYFAEEKVGCHPKSVRPPARGEFEEYLTFADVILTATCAPELPGAADFYRAAAAEGIRLNAGHSNATWAEMAAAHQLGVRHVDHFYCAMSSVSSLRERYGTPMQASMMEFVLDIEDVTTEVIADGRHLSPELLRFVVKWKGADKTALVTDCNRALDQPPGMYIFGPLDGGEPFYSDGAVGLLPDSESPYPHNPRKSAASLASSVRGMDFMVRHMHRQAGVDLPTAVRMATLTPATIVGWSHEIGSLEVGKRADVLLLDADLAVRTVFVDGERAITAGSSS